MTVQNSRALKNRQGIFSTPLRQPRNLLVISELSSLLESRSL